MITKMLYLFKITDYNRINLLDALVQYIRSEIYYIGFTPKNQTLNKYFVANFETCTALTAKAHNYD